jgi:hypothetical protein
MQHAHVRDRPPHDTLAQHSERGFDLWQFRHSVWGVGRCPDSVTVESYPSFGTC